MCEVARCLILLHSCCMCLCPCWANQRLDHLCVDLAIKECTSSCARWDGVPMLTSPCKVVGALLPTSAKKDPRASAVSCCLKTVLLPFWHWPPDANKKIKDSVWMDCSYKITMEGLYACGLLSTVRLEGWMNWASGAAHPARSSRCSHLHCLRPACCEMFGKSYSTTHQ